MKSLTSSQFHTSCHFASMSNTETPTIQTNLRTIAELIKNVRVAMMFTQRDDRFNLDALKGRPMYTQKVDPETFEGVLWFFTDASTSKVHEIETHPRVLLSYAMPEENTYALVYGNAVCDQDEAKARALWNIHAKGWWPEGPTSASLRIIRVQIDSAEYWQGPSNASYMLSLLKAVATGQQVNINAQHGVVDAAKTL